MRVINLEWHPGSSQERDPRLSDSWMARKAIFMFRNLERGVERAIDLPDCQELEDFASSDAC